MIRSLSGLRSHGRVLVFRAPSSSVRRRLLARDFENKARTANASHSPLYTSLLRSAADDILRGGPTWRVLEDYRPSSAALDDGLPWRFLSGVHALVLRGRAPDLARFYPSAGGGADGDAWPAFVAVLESDAEELRDLLRRPCQTNDVTRARALLPGFLTVARETGLPLRVLELGASMGLNLRWDRFHYDYGDSGTWGDPASPVRLEGETIGAPPALDANPRVVERRGCDLAPLDPASADDREWLLASSFPDDARFTAVARAIDLAATVPAQVDRAPAGDWLEAELGREVEGTATVVFHSVFLRYLTKPEQRRLTRAVEAAGTRATTRRPLARLQMEGVGQHEVRLTTWPGGSESVLGRTDPQGHRVRWLEARDDERG